MRYYIALEDGDVVGKYQGEKPELSEGITLEEVDLETLKNTSVDRWRYE